MYPLNPDIRLDFVNTQLTEDENITIYLSEGMYRANRGGEKKHR